MDNIMIDIPTPHLPLPEYGPLLHLPTPFSHQQLYPLPLRNVYNIMAYNIM